MKINVAITGTLSEPRSKVAKRINETTNGCFVESVTLSTHYLVCEKHDSKKARKAAQYGTAVISEAELKSIFELNTFPAIALPDYLIHRPNNFPEIMWNDIYGDARVGMLTYRDADGNYSIRTVALTASGISGQHEWFAGYDGDRFKTFRHDRVISFERRV